MSIENNAFWFRISLRRVIFAGNALETIGGGAFAWSGLESFVALASLYKIESLVFANCKNLNHVDLSACTL